MLNNFDNKYIGEEIKKARKAKRITREQLAEKVNIDAKQIYRIENGLSSPKLENFLKIAEFLNLKIKYFEKHNLPHNHYTNSFLEIINDSTSKELALYLKIIKTLKSY